MKIIVAEKSIAGKRIAELLAEGSIAEKREAGAQYWKFSKGKEDFELIPLRGHIIELDFPPKFKNWYGTDLKELVNAEILYTASEKHIAELLKEKAENAEEAIIATDADREGESIGLEALRFLRQGNAKLKESRAYFSAITPKEINSAFSKTQKVDYNLADSADARREIDLIWGAVLTRFVSLISARTGKEFLSVGRVQTPTLGLVVNREKERNAFKKTPYWELKAVLEKDAQQFEAMHKQAKFLNEQEAKKAFENASKAEYGIVKKVLETKRTLAKPIPFNTTEFLRAASSIGISPGEAMQIAESLYMQGIISYPRTDNTAYPESIDLKELLNNLLQTEFAKLAERILAKGKLEPSRGKETKDHPPIHPELPAQKNRLSEKQWKIYELVARRFLATLAENCETENLSVEIALNTEPFIAKGQLIAKLGWKEYYPYSAVSETRLPNLKEGDKCKKIKLGNERKETQPPARYSQAALIKLMEQLGLGTKSTRAEVIQKLYNRQYIFGSKAIEPSKIAFAVIDALQKYCETVTKPEMTSELEKKMDEIAEGKKQKSQTVEDSRKMLYEILESLLGKKIEIAEEMRKGMIADSILGKCGKCNGSLRMMLGRTGKRFVGCTGYPKCTNSYPLPQKGKVTWLGKDCEVCKAPMIEVFGTRGKYQMCLNMECKTKEAWKKKAESVEKKTKEDAIKITEKEGKENARAKESVEKVKEQEKSAEPKIPEKAKRRTKPRKTPVKKTAEKAKKVSKKK